MGFDPFRKSRKTVLDISLVVGFALLILAFVLWGFLG